MVGSCPDHALSAQARYCYSGFMTEWASVRLQEGAPGTETVWQR